MGISWWVLHYLGSEASYAGFEAWTHCKPVICLIKMVSSQALRSVFFEKLHEARPQLFDDDWLFEAKPDALSKPVETRSGEAPFQKQHVGRLRAQAMMAAEMLLHKGQGLTRPTLSAS